MDFAKIEDAAANTFKRLTADVGASTKEQLADFIGKSVRAAFEAYEEEKQLEA